MNTYSNLQLYLKEELRYFYTLFIKLFKNQLQRKALLVYILSAPFICGFNDKNTELKNKTLTINSLRPLAMEKKSKNTTQQEGSEPSLKQAVEGKFLMGVALNTRQIDGLNQAETHLIKHHFNSIVAENCMKSYVVHPEKDRFDFENADKLVSFGEENGMTVIGHCLIWHSQVPDWFFVDDEGKQITPVELKKRMRDYIHRVVGRYKGRIKGWDVVNEAIESDGSWRKSLFYEILGKEFISLAFQYAHEADPQAELYYNDYGMDGKAKRDKVVELIHSLKKRGLRIDAVGMQAHLGMDYPKLPQMEQSILSFSQSGVKVMITEWDMSVLPTVQKGANIADTVTYRTSIDPYRLGLPESISQAWNQRMNEFFSLFLKHSQVITRVTVWGLTDGDSWKNNFPVKGRIDYPLLFDRNYKPKPFVNDILKKNNHQRKILHT